MSEWKQHDGGGPCPVPKDAVVEIEDKSGAKRAGYADAFGWERGCYAYVSRYRQLTPGTEPERETVLWVGLRDDGFIVHVAARHPQGRHEDSVVALKRIVVRWRPGEFDQP